MTEAIIFDMDGVMIDSEPLWKIAIIRIMKNYGYDFTIQKCNETKGMRVDEVTAYWKNKLLANFDSNIMATEIVEEVISLIKEKGEPMDGLILVLKKAREKNLKIGLATSSSYQIIKAVLDKLNVENYFDVIQSAELEDFGKPHPQVFITTAVKLGVTPINCLVIEDSLNGVIAAKAAKMKVIAIPEKEERNLPQYSIADNILNSLQEVTF